MKTNFDAALSHVLLHEGGWADHPRDPGGATMKGVTLATYRRYFGVNKSKSDLRNIADEELKQIYRSGYWNKCRCDTLPLGIDYAVFDGAVNSGPARSGIWLQGAVGAKQDGKIGNETISLVEKQEPPTVIDTVCDRRLSFLRGLSTWPTFGKGWGRRVESVRTTAMGMNRGDSASFMRTVPSVDYTVVRKGSTGPWVRKLQEALGIQVDGKFGADTEAALIRWQRRNGVQPDGIAGRVTYRALGLIE